MATATISIDAAALPNSEAWESFDAVCQHYLSLSGRRIARSNPAGAFQSFVHPLQRALSCVAMAKFIRSPLRSDLTQTLALQPLPLRLPKSSYQIFCRHSYRSSKREMESGASLL